jgi:outer membrane immunogenic protein
MKSIALAATLVALHSGTAHAADLTRKAPPAPVTPVASWTGFYVGVNVGGGWSNTDVGYGTSDTITALFFGAGIDLPANGERIGSSSGVLGGVQIGYNYQFAPAWVAGIETDFQFANIEGSGSTAYFAGALTSSASQDIQYFGTVRARLGYLATDRLMIYATGGFAYAQLNNAVALDVAPGGFAFFGGLVNGVAYTTNCGFGFPNTCLAGASNGLTPGWTVGGGLEYALGQNWSLKGEYLYARFEQTVTAASVTPTAGTQPNTYTAKFATDLNVVRVGLNYKF